MSQAKRRIPHGHVGESPEEWLRVELESMDRVHKRVMKSRASMIAFLNRAGILTKRGKLTKEYRS